MRTIVIRVSFGRLRAVHWLLACALSGIAAPGSMAQTFSKEPGKWVAPKDINQMPSGAALETYKLKATGIGGPPKSDLTAQLIESLAHDVQELKARVDRLEKKQ